MKMIEVAVSKSTQTEWAREPDLRKGRTAEGAGFPTPVPGTSQNMWRTVAADDACGALSERMK